MVRKDLKAEGTLDAETINRRIRSAMLKALHHVENVDPGKFPGGFEGREEARTTLGVALAPMLHRGDVEAYRRPTWVLLRHPDDEDLGRLIDLLQAEKIASLGDLLVFRDFASIEKRLSKGEFVASPALREFFQSYAHVRAEEKKRKV